jgi:hypothetical protein
VGVTTRPITPRYLQVELPDVFQNAIVTSISMKQNITRSERYKDNMQVCLSHRILAQAPFGVPSFVLRRLLLAFSCRPCVFDLLFLTSRARARSDTRTTCRCASAGAAPSLRLLFAFRRSTFRYGLSFSAFCF